MLQHTHFFMKVFVKSFCRGNEEKWRNRRIRFQNKSSEDLNIWQLLPFIDNDGFVTLKHIKSAVHKFCFKKSVVPNILLQHQISLTIFRFTFFMLIK